MGRGTKEVNLFDYLDYRNYLRDYYGAAKKSRAGFSLRTFSKKAGFTSSNYFKLVMDGDRNLTEVSLGKFVKGLDLNKQEQDFFRNLVFYNQARAHEQKNSYYQRLLQSQKFSRLKPIEKNQYEFYSAWYHAVIRELITAAEFDGTVQWLKNRIFPELTESQIEKSIALLESLGFIQKGENGKWTQSTPLVTTGAEADSVTMINYHQNLLELAMKQLTRIPAAERDFSVLTLGIAKERLPAIKKKVQEFRREILKMVSTDTNAEEVILVAIQMFPVTRGAEELRNL